MHTLNRFSKETDLLSKQIKEHFIKWAVFKNPINWNPIMQNCIKKIKQNVCFISYYIFIALTVVKIIIIIKNLLSFDLNFLLWKYRWFTTVIFFFLTFDSSHFIQLIWFKCATDSDTFNFFMNVRTFTSGEEVCEPSLDRTPLLCKMKQKNYN